MSDQRTNPIAARFGHCWRCVPEPRALTGALLTATVMGCAPAGTNIAGTVTLDGRPVEEATLQFYPAAGDGQTSHAITGKAGKFLARVSPVPLVVTISKSKPTGQKIRAFPDASPVDEMTESLSPRYADRKKTELKVTPVNGKTRVSDFALTSDEK